jgi:hypothetical protein
LVWTPTGAGRVYLFTVRVRDDGAPPLSATQSFSVTVHAPPQVTISTPIGPTVVLTWSAAPGTRYGVAYKNYLSDSNWTSLPVEVVAEDVTATLSLPHVGVQRFYRIMILP